MTRTSEIRAKELNQICECGHRRGVHNVINTQCITYPYPEEPYKLCKCKGFKPHDK